MVMAALSKKRLWQIALELIPQFRIRSVEADVIAYNIGISSCERSKAWSKAIELLDTMPQEGLVPDEVTLNSVMSACSRSWACAVEVFRESILKSTAASTYSFNSCIGACERGGQWKLASSLFDCMSTGNVEADVYTITLTMNACRAKPESWLTALGLLEEMPPRKLCPNEVTYSSVMQACFSSRQWKEVLHCFNTMHSESVAPGAITYNIAIRACAGGACWQPEAQYDEVICLCNSGISA